MNEIKDKNQTLIKLKDVMQWFLLNCSNLNDRILKAKDNILNKIIDLFKKSFEFEETDNDKIILTEE